MALIFNIIIDQVTHTTHAKRTAYSTSKLIWPNDTIANIFKEYIS
jgi:hypothetical protein